MKVIYIVGKGRSGSTLLDNVLNQVPGVFSTGELWRRWGRRRMEVYRCGCGEDVANCEFWSRVLDRAYRSTGSDTGVSVDGETVLEWERELWTLRGNVQTVLTALGSNGPRGKNLGHLVTFMKHTYRAIREETESKVVVDSSKWPLLPGTLGLVEEVEPRVVHLVRDSRAVAHSWTRDKTFLPEGRPMPKFSTPYSILSWWYRNGLAEVSSRILGGGHVVRIRYEDLVSRPAATLHSILSLVDLEGSSLPLVGDRTVRMGPNHTMWGNKSRFRTGDVPLRRDDRWRDEQGAFSRWSTTILTAPLLARYGYLETERDR